MNNKVISISDISYDKLAEFISNIKIINIINYEYIVVYDVVEFDNSKVVLSKMVYQYSIYNFTDRFYLKINLKSILKEIISSLQILHNLSIFNCNINPHNILIDNLNHIYLSDYLINSIRSFNNIPLSSLIYLSPEEIESNEIKAKSDIWSIGCLIYYILTDTDLFTIQSLYLFINTIKTYEYSIHTVDITMEFEELISKCLRNKHNDRISLNELYTEISCDNNEEENIDLIVDNDIEIINKKEKNDEKQLLNQLINSYHRYNNSKYLYYIIKNILLSNYSEFNKFKIINEIKTYNPQKQFNWLENSDENLLVSVHQDDSLVYLSQMSEIELLYLIESFKYLKSIKILKINSFENSKSQFSVLCNNLSLLCNLKLISFQYISNEGIDILSNYLSLLTTLTINNEVCLDMSNKGINDDGLRELSLKLSDLPNLECLLLKWNNFIHIPDDFYECVNNNLTDLECLDISCCNINENELIKIKNNITSLKWLYLDQYSNTTD